MHEDGRRASVGARLALAARYLVAKPGEATCRVVVQHANSQTLMTGTAVTTRHVLTAGHGFDQPVHSILIWKPERKLAWNARLVCRSKDPDLALVETDSASLAPNWPRIPRDTARSSFNLSTGVRDSGSGSSTAG